MFINPSAGDYILPAKPTMEAAIMNHRQLDPIEKIQIKTWAYIVENMSKEKDARTPRTSFLYFLNSNRLLSFKHFS